MNTLNIITGTIFVVTLLSGLAYTMYKSHLMVKNYNHKISPLKKQRTHKRPETFSEFLRLNATEALIRFFEPVMWLKSLFHKLFKK